MVVAGPTTDVIYVLVPDNTTCSADEIAPADLQHVIGIRLGPAENLGSNLPREDLHLSLCENSLRPTLIADRRVYWAEITPLLQRWQSVNNTACPHCHRLIRVNMSRHLRASHTVTSAFGGVRYPHVICGLVRSSTVRTIWSGSTASERGRDAHFTGSVWNGSGHGAISIIVSSQAMWMDMALARQSGQELINHYIITNSPATAHIRHFFHASIRHLTATYQRIAAEQAFNDIRPSVCNQMRHELGNMETVKEEFDPLMDEASGYSAVQDGVVRRSPVVVTPRRSSTKDKSRESPVVDTPRRSSTMDTTTDSPVVDTPRRSSTSNNRSLAVMEASTLEAPHYCIPIARGSVNFTSIASLDLQTFIDPLPLDQLICYSAETVQSWPTEDREQILAVAGRDLTVARRNLAELTRYVDIHAAHLATCTGGSDDSIPLMAAETYPRLPGGIGAALQEVQRD